MLIPHLPVVISYIKDRVSKATIKGTNQNAFPMKELNILSVYVYLLNHYMYKSF